MKKFFGHLWSYFIPHKGNEYKPHSLRRESATLLLLAILFVQVAVIAGPIILLRGSDFLTAVLPGVLTVLTNEKRAQNKISPLVINPTLEKAAQMKAEDMVRRGYFSHNGPNGELPWSWLKRVGYKYSYAGENLAVNFFESADVAEAWMHSPTHRVNIVNANFTEIGIGVAQGLFEGKNSIFVVQFFGTPITTVVTKAPVQTKPVVSTIPTSSNQRVLGEATTYEAPPTTPTSLIGRALSSPVSMGTYIFWGLLSFVILALILTIFIKIDIQHSELIKNGLTLALFIILALISNYFLLRGKVDITNEPTASVVMTVVTE